MELIANYWAGLALFFTGAFIAGFATARLLISRQINRTLDRHRELNLFRLPKP